MEQQIQTGQTQPAQTKPEMQQPANGQTQPVKRKKSNLLMGLIIVLLIGGAGVGIYFLGKYLKLF